MLITSLQRFFLFFFSWVDNGYFLLGKPLRKLDRLGNDVSDRIVVKLGGFCTILGWSDLVLSTHDLNGRLFFLAWFEFWLIFLDADVVVKHRFLGRFGCLRSLKLLLLLHTCVRAIAFRALIGPFLSGLIHVRKCFVFSLKVSFVWLSLLLLLAS